MKISKEDIVHVAKLARLELKTEDIEKFSLQIGAILDYVDTLNQIDTKDVIPTSHAIFLRNAFREDEVLKDIDIESVFLNAPEKEDGTFLVPRVIG